ncbi:alcohol dehydrogenase catalytic domain-containing protein [Nocardia sp. ET3-3]|uniref:Alcohol dehydrogenase n=1 Tax=Nocardia terrae TaxID=2675851 RepID=A0A7K1US75_9NOCA|nr:alcohol dehydrogenase [Nocardia terrae]MVU77187.1 alcohol dehydrogenase catalytic domain-containing protein [Nocardia terrae]
MSATIRAVQIAAINGPLSLTGLPVAEPGPGQVRVTVEACAICHTDYNVVRGDFGAVPFPLTPGHEIAGRIDAVGSDVEDWAPGDRVAVGWFGGNCGRCVPCREGDPISCADAQVPGISYQGGYAEALVVPVSALARIPDGLSAVDAAPMGCAGVTVFNALRRSSARPGDLVAVLGIGGLGHLAIQFATKMGFATVAIARGADKEILAKELGADHYIDSTARDVAHALQSLGGAKVVLATVTEPSAMSPAIDGLRTRGEFVVVGASPQRLEISPYQLIAGQKTLRGHAAGTSRDIEETLRFAVQSGIRARSELVPLHDAPAAFAKMLAGRARFRVVLTTGR